MPHYHGWLVVGDDDDNDGGVAVAVAVVIGHIKETGSDAT